MRTEKYNNRSEFYRLSLTDNTQQVELVDIIADSDKNKENYEKILKICPAGSRCTITGNLETRERQSFIKFVNIKNIVKETKQITNSNSRAVSTPDTGIKLYKNVEMTGYIKCKIEHFGTQSDYYLLSINDSSDTITFVHSIQNEYEGNEYIYKRILSIYPEGSRCTITGDLKVDL